MKEFPNKYIGNKEENNSSADESVNPGNRMDKLLSEDAKGESPKEIADKVLSFNVESSQIDSLLGLGASVMSPQKSLAILNKIYNKLQDQELVQDLINGPEKGGLIEYKFDSNYLDYAIISIVRKLLESAGKDPANHERLEEIALELIEIIEDNDVSADRLDPEKFFDDFENLPKNEQDKIYDLLEQQTDMMLQDGSDAYFMQQSKEEIIIKLGAFGSQHSVDKLFSLMKKEPTAYPKFVAPMASKAAPEFAAKKAMKEMREEEYDSPYKRDLAKVLYRLELGRIGISEDGVNYLERQYDLKELNNPDFFARRLTGTGEMGVFDEAGEMQGMFNLGDLMDGKKEVAAEVYDLTYEMLFVPRDDETEEERERREEILADFKKHYFDFYGEEFQEQTGVYFNNLELREQGAFMQFNREASEKQAEDAMALVKRFGEPGLQSFVSHAENPKMGSVLLELAEELSEQDAKSLFRHYSGFVRILNNLESYISAEFDLENTDAVANNVASKILKRGEDMLQDVSENPSKIEDIVGQISHLSDSALVFLQTLQSMRLAGLDVESGILKRSEMAHLDSVDVTSDMRAQMKDIYTKNYPADEYSLEQQRHLLEKLDHLLQSQHSEFYLFSHADEVKSFLAFEQDVSKEHERPTKQAAGFNVDPDFQNYTLGSFMIDNALKKEAARSTLIARANAENNIISHYIEHGFVATHESEAESSSTMLDIVWDEPENRHYKFKNTNKSQIINMLDKETIGAVSGADIVSADNLANIDYKRRLEQNNQALTRLFFHEGKWIAAFETKSTKLYPDSMG